MRRGTFSTGSDFEGCQFMAQFDPNVGVPDVPGEQ